MELTKLMDSEEFNKYRLLNCDKRLKVENFIAIENKSNENWTTIGFCEVCDKESKFLLDWKYSNNLIPNYRERLVCEYCGLNNRQRFIVSYLKSLVLDEGSKISNIYLYEQVTSFYTFIKDRFCNINIVGSEYLGYNRRSGEIVDGIRHEDALDLSFDDNSIDIIISNDVFEHVPNIHQALSEAYRVLRDKGRLIFSIPFYYYEKETKVRAILQNGQLKHIMQEQYHGNPVSEKGSLVFYDFGWDILDICKEAGFKSAYMLSYYSMFYGYLGEGLQFIFIAKK